MIQHVNARWFDLDCLVVIFWSLYFLNALQSDNNSKRVYVQVLGMFWALIPRTLFNSRLAARAKMSMTRAQTYLCPEEHKLYFFNEKSCVKCMQVKFSYYQ